MYTISNEDHQLLLCSLNAFLSVAPVKTLKEQNLRRRARLLLIKLAKKQTINTHTRYGAYPRKTH